MKYVSIDLETGGLNPETCSIIEFGAVADDLTKPLEEAKTFQTYILNETYTGEPYALQMHSEIFKKISDWKESKNKEITICPLNLLITNFWMFLRESGYHVSSGSKIEINVAGKNFYSFDIHFLEKIDFSRSFKIHRRALDPAILYFNPLTDTTLPDTKTCMERAGFTNEVAHTALDDALMVCKLLRHKLI